MQSTKYNKTNPLSPNFRFATQTIFVHRFKIKMFNNCLTTNPELTPAGRTCSHGCNWGVTHMAACHGGAGAPFWTGSSLFPGVFWNNITLSTSQFNYLTFIFGSYKNGVQAYGEVLAAQDVSKPKPDGYMYPWNKASRVLMRAEDAQRALNHGHMAPFRIVQPLWLCVLFNPGL